MAAVAQAISLRGIGSAARATQRPRGPAGAVLSAISDALALLLRRHVVRHPALQFGVGVGGGWGDRQGVVGAGVLLGARGACCECSGG